MTKRSSRLVKSLHRRWLADWAIDATLASYWGRRMIVGCALVASGIPPLACATPVTDSAFEKTSLEERISTLGSVESARLIAIPDSVTTITGITPHYLLARGCEYSARNDIEISRLFDIVKRAKPENDRHDAEPEFRQAIVFETSKGRNFTLTFGRLNSGFQMDLTDSAGLLWRGHTSSGELGQELDGWARSAKMLRHREPSYDGSCIWHLRSTAASKSQ
jgi:hypothetical protein